MRDGLPVVSLVLSFVAVIVALAGFFSRGPVETTEPPDEALRRAERSLANIQKERQSIREEMASLERTLTRAVEQAPGARSAGVDTAELEARLRVAVEAQMTKLLAERARKVGAPAPKLTAKQKREQNFERMLAELRKSAGIAAGGKAEAVRSILSRLRAKLNAVYTANKKDHRKRNTLAASERGRADAELNKVLGPAGFKKFDAWRKRTKDRYAKTFFGR